MSLVDGFRQGFGMMSDYYNRQDTKEYRQEQLGLQNRRMNMAEESHNANMQTSALNRTLLQGQVDDMPAAAEHTNTMRGLQVRGQQLSVDGKETQNEINDFKFRSAKTNQGYKDEPLPRPRAQESLKAYEATENWEGFVQDPVFKGTPLEPFQHVEGADDAIALNEARKAGDIDTVVSKSNILFKAQLNRNVGKMKGRDGGIVRDISIIDYVQQPDGSVKVPVRVTTDKGTYNSFVSELRGIDPNDPDKVFSAEDLFGKAEEMGKLGTILKSSGVYERVSEAAGRYLGTGKSDQPAKIQELEYIRQFIGTEGLQNFLMYGRGKSPQQVYADAQKVALNIIKNDPKAMQLTPEQVNAQVQQLATQLTQQTVAANGQGGQPGAQQPALNPNVEAFQQWIQSANSQQGQ